MRGLKMGISAFLGHDLIRDKGCGNPIKDLNHTGPTAPNFVLKKALKIV
jgi:hypothetical protein